MSDHWNVLIPAEVIQKRIDDIAISIQKFIDQSERPVVLALVAQGGVWLGMQLGQRLKPESYRWGLVGTSSYGGAETGKKVDLTFNRTGDVSGHTVLIVDDIGDRRKTLEFLRDLFIGPEKALSVSTAVLLNKPSRQEADIPLDFVGFEIPDTFVAGCGLDGGEKFPYTRNYPDVRYKWGTLPTKATLNRFWLPSKLPA